MKSGPPPVRIEVDPKTGKVKCTPKYAVFEPGETLRWQYDEGAWTIHFRDNRKPVEAFDIIGYGDTVHGDVSKHTVNVEEGLFRYAVAVASRDKLDRREPAIFLEAACPTIIIGRRTR